MKYRHKRPYNRVKDKASADTQRTDAVNCTELITESMERAAGEKREEKKDRREEMREGCKRVGEKRGGQRRRERDRSKI